MTVDADIEIVIAAAICTFQGDVDMNRHLGAEVVRVLAEYGYQVVSVTTQSS